MDSRLRCRQRWYRLQQVQRRLCLAPLAPLAHHHFSIKATTDIKSLRKTIFCHHLCRTRISRKKLRIKCQGRENKNENKNENFISAQNTKKGRRLSAKCSNKQIKANGFRTKDIIETYFWVIP